MPYQANACSTASSLEPIAAGTTVLDYYGIEGINPSAHMGFLSLFFLFFFMCAWCVWQLGCNNCSRAVQGAVRGLASAWRAVSSSSTSTLCMVLHRDSCKRIVMSQACSVAQVELHPKFWAKTCSHRHARRVTMSVRKYQDR